MATKLSTSILSVYIPKRHTEQQLVERLNQLAAKRDRSVNYLTVEAILQYLDRSAPVTA